MQKLITLGAALLFSLGLAACGDDDGTTTPDGGNVDQAVVTDTGGVTPDTGGVTPDTGGTTPDTGGPTPDMMADSGGGQSCTTCHATPPSSGRHGKHGKFGCSTCHSEVVDSNNNIIDATLHNNGTKNVKGNFTWNGTSCSGASCHGTETW